MSRRCSSSFFGKRKKTIAAPSRIATIPARYAHWSPSRNACFAPAVICVAYCGYCPATADALENDFVSSLCTLSETDVGDPDSWLAAGYTQAASAAIASANAQVSQSVQSQLTKSFAGAEEIAKEYPKYADQITAAARASFVQGDHWAYLAGVVAVLLGAGLVAWRFPRRDEEAALLERYRTEA